MITFGDFLAEAKISARNLDKAADIFKRMVEKRLGVKYFRFGGPKGFSEIKNGVGILYIAPSAHAMRINYKAGEIESITLWRRFRLNQPGDFTIDLGGIGLLQAGKKLIDVISSPSAQKIAVYPEIVESYLAEATRVTPAFFAELVQKNLPPSITLDAVPWSVIADIALANDYQIPTIVRTGTKAFGRGKKARFDLTKLLTGEDIKTDIEAKAKDNEPIYYIKVTSQDPNTKKFMSVKGDKKAEGILQNINKTLNNPDVKKEMQDPDTLFGKMRDLTRVVCRGVRNSLVIYGGAGIGKTFVVGETIKDEGLKLRQDYFIVKGKITTSALYQTLFIHRDNKLIVFDDTDSLWGDPDAANILKAALDSYEERTISWFSPKNVNVSKMSDEDREAYNEKLDTQFEEDPEGKMKLPSEFNFDSRIIFISNLPYEKFDKAVLNRSAKIDMSLTQEQLFQRMKSILPYMGDKSVPVEVKEEILEFLKEEFYKGELSSASMRTYVAAEDLYRSGLENWKDLLGNV